MSTFERNFNAKIKANKQRSDFKYSENSNENRNKNKKRITNIKNYYFFSNLKQQFIIYSKKSRKNKTQKI